MDLQTPVVADESQFPEPVHEKANPGSGGTHHFGQSLLANFGNYRLRYAVFAKMSEQQKNPGQPLLARIEKLIN
jgi:hypothetical protein